MFPLAWRMFLDRWPVFIGAIITVCLGVALVQSSLLILISAATVPVPAGLTDAAALIFREAYDGVIVLLSMVLALVTFVAVFIVSSTFSFAVSQRQQELALLRLTGASRQQVRALLVGEAMLLGVVGSALGIVAGLPVMRLQMWILNALDFAPPGFDAQWRWWIVLVSLGTGVLIAVLGVLAASRRASSVRPLEALRESGDAARVMTATRWVLGLLLTAAGVFLLIFFPAGDADLPIWFIQITPFLVTVPLVVGFSALAPLMVPLVGRLFGLVLRGPLGQLAMSNLRFDAQRSAATAAPIMLLVAFVASIAGTLSTVSEGAQQETLHTVQGDLVVTADRQAVSEIAGLDGVQLVSAETAVLVEFRAGDEYGDEWYEAYEGVATDPATYVSTHDLQAVEGDIADLHGYRIAVSPNAWERNWDVGDTLEVRLAGVDREVEIAALLPGSVSGPYILLSPELIPADASPWLHIVQLADDTDLQQISARLSQFGEVATVDQWVAEASSADERQTLNIMIVLLGMTMLYTIIAMINAVVISASARRREFAALRVTGLTRGQVVRVAFWESQAVVIIGVLLGALAAAASVWGVAIAIRDVIGITVVSTQWPLVVVLVLGSAIVVGVTNVFTTLSTTRVPPIQLVASRE